jgi:hypothetical protein
MGSGDTAWGCRFSRCPEPSVHGRSAAPKGQRPHGHGSIRPSGSVRRVTEARVRRQRAACCDSGSGRGPVATMLPNRRDPGRPRGIRQHLCRRVRCIRCASRPLGALEVASVHAVHLLTHVPPRPRGAHLCHPNRQQCRPAREHVPTHPVRLAAVVRGGGPRPRIRTEHSRRSSTDRLVVSQSVPPVRLSFDGTVPASIRFWMTEHGALSVRSGCAASPRGSMDDRANRCWVAHGCAAFRGSGRQTPAR